jgi:hypothetical protein
MLGRNGVDVHASNGELNIMAGEEPVYVVEASR